MSSEMLSPKLEAIMYSKFTNPTPEMLSLFITTLDASGWITGPEESVSEITEAWENAIACNPLTIHDFALFIAFKLEFDNDWSCELTWKDEDDPENLTDVGSGGVAKHLRTHSEAIADGVYFLPTVGACSGCDHKCKGDSEFLAAMYKAYTNKVSTW
jgi:hypothetical protein